MDDVILKQELKKLVDKNDVNSVDDVFQNAKFQEKIKKLSKNKVEQSKVIAILKEIIEEKQDDILKQDDDKIEKMKDADIIEIEKKECAWNKIDSKMREFDNYIRCGKYTLEERTEKIKEILFELSASEIYKGKYEKFLYTSKNERYSDIDQDSILDICIDKIEYMVTNYQSIEEKYLQGNFEHYYMWAYFRKAMQTGLCDYIKKKQKDALGHWVDKIGEDGEQIGVDEFAIANENMEEITNTIILFETMKEIVDTVSTRKRSNKDNMRNQVCRMAYTDWGIKKCQDIKNDIGKIDGEDRIMESMSKEFLDFLMSKPCDTLNKIRETRAKTYLEVYGEEFCRNQRFREDKKILSVEFLLSSKAYVHFYEVVKGEKKGGDVISRYKVPIINLAQEIEEK